VKKLSDNKKYIPLSWLFAEPIYEMIKKQRGKVLSESSEETPEGFSYQQLIKNVFGQSFSTDLRLNISGEQQ